MTLSISQLTNGLTPEHDLVFASKPENPEMRESTSVWLYDDQGKINFPRFGIEAEAHSWDTPLYTANVSFPDGRLLCAISKGQKPLPFGSDGRPTVLGAGPMTISCLELFRRWRVRYDGMIADGTSQQTIEKSYNLANLVPFKLEFDLEIVTPAFVMDNSPDKVAGMSAADRQEAEYMGLGWRCEQLFRGRGRYEVDGKSHDFAGSGLRVKRQSVRPLGGFRGHSWQSALFPDGRAFGYIAYPPREVDGKAYNAAYIYQDGRMHIGRAVEIPWLRRLQTKGESVPLAIETDLGVIRIDGVTTAAYFHRAHPGVANLDLGQGGARYTWGGQHAYGMIERSAAPDLVST